jgi:hypothetical protein
VENSANSRKQQEKPDREGRKPPGQFVSDELEEQTARFLETAKTLAERRRKRDSKDSPGPPPPAGGQRSRRL